jgi:hypothetical protein
MNQKETNINRTLSMGEHIERVTPSDELLSRLRAVPSSIQPITKVVSMKVVWTAAASVALLIALNFISAREYKQSKSTQQTTESVSDSYFSYLKSV